MTFDQFMDLQSHLGGYFTCTHMICRANIYLLQLKLQLLALLLVVLFFGTSEQNLNRIYQGTTDYVQ
jgi:hypothetical protein